MIILYEVRLCLSGFYTAAHHHSIRASSIAKSNSESLQWTTWSLWHFSFGVQTLLLVGLLGFFVLFFKLLKFPPVSFLQWLSVQLGQTFPSRGSLISFHNTMLRALIQDLEPETHGSIELILLNEHLPLPIRCKNWLQGAQFWSPMGKNEGWQDSNWMPLFHWFQDQHRL